MRTPDKWEYDDERVDAISQIRASAYTQDDADLVVPGYVVTKILDTTPLLLGDAASCWPTSLRNTDEYCLIKRTTLEAYLSELILGEYAPIASAEIVDDWITTRDKVRDYLGGLVVV